MDLSRDAFTITFDPAEVAVAAITSKIRGLGYTPELAPEEGPEDRAEAKPPQPIPEPVAAALAEARSTDRLYF